MPQKGKVDYIMEVIRILKSKEILYFTFPWVTLAVCLLIEWTGSKFFPPATGWPFFIAWPLLLVIWLVYWGIKTPKVVSTFYYFVVAVVCVELVTATSTGFLCTFLGTCEDTMKYISQKYMSRIFWVILILWGIHRWSVKKKLQTQDKQENES